MKKATSSTAKTADVKAMTKSAKASQPAVSIVVPIYNVEKYLRQCVDSIVNQTLKNIEIVLVNDGSTDSSLKIMQEYAANDPRVKTIDKKNEGYGKTMNRGMDAATGEYISIVESDDWIEPDMLETLYSTAKQNDVDIAKCDFVFFNSETGATWESGGFGIPAEMHGQVYNPRKYPLVFWTGHPSIWTCIYKTKMMRDKNVRFSEMPGASFQDMGFKPKIFAAADTFVFIPKKLMHYRKHPGNSDRTNGKVFAVRDSHNDTDAWAREQKFTAPDFIKIFNRTRWGDYNWNLLRLSGENKEEFRRAFMAEFMPIIRACELYINDLDSKEMLKIRKFADPNNIWLKILYALTNVRRLILLKDKQKNGYMEYRALFGLILIYKKKIG